MDDLLGKPARCLLVQPRFSGHTGLEYSEVARFLGARYSTPPLGLMTVAALFPQHWEFRLIDENVRPLTDADLEWAEIVLTGGMLSQQRNILRTIESAHDLGVPVVIGGPGPTSQPHIYKSADFLVLGEGEVTIPSFLEGLEEGSPSGLYQSDQSAEMTQAVVPRFDLVRFRDYIRVDVQFSRGCPFNCEFCDVIELFGRRFRTKTPHQILAELQALYDLGYRGHVNFVDDNFFGHRAKAIQLLEAIGDWSKWHKYPFYFSTNATINVAKDKTLLRLLHENDFRYMFVGIESPDEHVLIQTQKKQNTLVPTVDAVKALNRHGMIVLGGFILGFDGETQHTARHMADLIQEAGICIAYVTMLYALPNTQLTCRLQREGRLFSEDRTIVEESGEEVERMTIGLNFATSRPRTAILRDCVHVFRELYDPGNYYGRILRSAANLSPRYKYRPRFKRVLKLIRGFLMVCARAGFNRCTGLLYWKTLFKVLATNPRAINMAVTMATAYVHLGKHAEYLVHLHEGQIEHVKTVGEENYNRKMIPAYPNPGRKIRFFEEEV